MLAIQTGGSSAKPDNATPESNGISDSPAITVALYFPSVKDIGFPRLTNS